MLFNKRGDLKFEWLIQQITLFETNTTLNYYILPFSNPLKANKGANGKAVTNNVTNPY